MSQAPCTLGSPRSALTPLPGFPTLPRSSLQDGETADALHAGGVLRHAERVQDRAGPILAIVSAMRWISAAGMPVMRSPISSV
jgi:hypothetical protein